jgi:prophage antirepressor-like protein
MNTLLQIEIYTFQNKQMRVLGTYEDPWFAVKDICTILGISNVTMALKNIPEKWKGVKKFLTPSGEQEMLVVNEAGFYKLIIRSTKPEAQPFQEWACEEVFPSIRKKGEYILQEYKAKLEAQQKLLEQKEAEVQTQNTRVKYLEEKYLQNRTRIQYPKINMIYLTTDKYSKIYRTYLLGKTDNLTNRLSGYNKKSESEVVYYKECKANNVGLALCEQMIFYRLYKYREVLNRERFILPDDKELTLFTDVIDEVLNFVNNDDIPIDARAAIPLDCVKRQNDTAEFGQQTDADFETITIPEQIVSHSLQPSSKPIVDKQHDKTKRTQTEKILRDKYNFKNNKQELYCKSKNYRLMNKNKFKSYNKVYYFKNLSKILSRVKKYKKLNPEKVTLWKKKYNEKKKLNPVIIKCDCGSEYRKNEQSRHMSSTKHMTYLKSQDIVDIYLIEKLEEKHRHISENQRKVREKRKTRKEKIVCDCGSTFTNTNFNDHIKTTKHINYLKSLESKDEVLIIKLEKSKETKDVKILCECGIEYKKKSKNSHMTSDRHIQFLKLNSQNTAMIKDLENKNKKQKESDKKINEKAKSKRSEKIKCECGAEVTKSNYLKHTKTTKHTQWTTNT